MLKIFKWLKNRGYQPNCVFRKIAASWQIMRAGAQFDTADATSHLVHYDKSLLVQTRTQWHLGDWASLANTARNTLQHHPDRAKLALLAKAGQMPSTNIPEPQQRIRMAQDWGCNRRIVSQVLVAGVYKRLVNAALIAGDQHRALGHCKTAANLANQKTNAGLLAEVGVIRSIRAQAAVQHKNRQIAQPNASVLPTLAKPDDGVKSTRGNRWNSISKSFVSLLLRLAVQVHCLRLRALTQMIWKWNKVNIYREIY